MKDKERLTAIGCILIAAGTDMGYITLNRADVDLLGLLDCKDQLDLEVQPSRMMGYLQPDAPLPKVEKVKRLAGKVGKL